MSPGGLWGEEIWKKSLSQKEETRDGGRRHSIEIWKSSAESLSRRSSDSLCAVLLTGQMTWGLKADCWDEHTEAVSDLNNGACFGGRERA